ncbi:MAG: DUF5675 family protein [Cyclobacteriaceae bacterium]
MTRIKTILLFLLTVISLMSVGQVFPVQSTVQLTPPYSLYLSDYAAPGSERLRVTAFLIDATRPELNVRFRLRIEGNGIKIETKPEFLPPPVTLLGGVPLQLISSDLAAYFDPRNLNFTGITQREVEQRGALPEGLYQFCFEVIEYNRGAKISNTGCATAWLILNDPPIVNLPRDNEKIRIQDPQQVIFQWTPRHRGSPNSAFNAEYDFKLVEVWPSIRNPNDAILTSPPIFQTTTSETTLVYGPAETPLEPGRRYAFQLRARAYAGADELSLFKNNGFSQVYTFVYGDACLAPQNIITSDVGTTRFTVNFDGAPNQTGYSLRYRPIRSSSPSLPERGTGGEVWYTNTSLTPTITVNSLQPNTRYEYQVNSGCGTFTSDYSPLTNITTKDNPGITYSCGIPLNPFNLDPSQLIDVLKVGDIIKAGDFDVVLSKVTGSNGVFSGEGVVEVSYFNRAKVKAEFTNISISKELRMVNGYMNVTGAGVEIVPAGLLNLMDDLDEVLAQADKFLNEYEANLPEQFDVNAAVTSTLITVPGTATISQGSNGSVVIVDGSGKRTELPAGTTASVVDGTGKGYIIDSKGKVHTTTAAIATQAANREYNLKLKFAASAEQKFGFDEKQYDPIASTYTKIENQYLSWKSLATGQTDKALAILEGTGIDKSKVRFELNGSVVNSQWSSVNGSSPPMTNDQSTIDIRGTGDGIEEELIALYPGDKKDQVLGKLSVVTYDEIVKNLVIVPINGNKYPYSEDALRTQLNKIYGQAVVKWNITFANNFDVPSIDPFDDGGSGLLSNYSPDMRKVVSAYKANIQPHTYYLFLVKNPKTGTLAGFMPRSKECGFIFINSPLSSGEGQGGEAAIIHTMAHELGHGAFSLRHTFTEEKNTLPEKSTDNLMDYANGNKLFKYQWDRMRYPEIVMGLFEDDDAGALSLPCLGIFDDCGDVLAIIKAIKSRIDSDKLLPVLMPNKERNRKELYTGNYLTVGGTDFNKIIIKNETKKDESINPKIYFDYVEGKKEKFSAGFMFKLSDSSTFKIIVAEEKDSSTTISKVEKLRKYIFGDILAVKQKQQEQKAEKVKGKIVIVSTKVYESTEGTVSSFSIDDGMVTGYFLERPSGTADQEKTAGSQKRIPAGDYTITFPHPESTRDCKDIESWVRTDLISGNGRGGILIHRGGLPWNSTGCLLAGSTYNTEYVLTKDYESKDYGTTFTKGSKTIYINGWTDTCEGNKTEEIANYYKKVQSEMGLLESDWSKITITIKISR